MVHGTLPPDGRERNARKSLEYLWYSVGSSISSSSHPLLLFAPFTSLSLLHRFILRLTFAALPQRLGLLLMPLGDGWSQPHESIMRHWSSRKTRHTELGIVFPISGMLPRSVRSSCLSPTTCVLYQCTRKREREEAMIRCGIRSSGNPTGCPEFHSLRSRPLSIHFARVISEI